MGIAQALIPSVKIIFTRVFIVQEYSLLFVLDPHPTFVQSQQWKHQNNVLNLFKVNDKGNRVMSRRHCGVFFVNFEQISYIALVFPFLTLNK